MQVSVYTWNHRTCQPWFVGELARRVNLSAGDHDNDFASSVPETKRLLEIRKPVYFEDDSGALGQCAICGKRGSFYRCHSCGTLAHVSCLGSTFECPRCVKEPLAAFDATKHGGVRRERLAKGSIVPPVPIEKAVSYTHLTLPTILRV